MLKSKIQSIFPFPCGTARATYLDTGNDVNLVKDVNERSSIIGLLVEGLLVQDDTRDVFVQTCGK